jgi:hypothetical protein
MSGLPPIGHVVTIFRVAKSITEIDPVAMKEVGFLPTGRGAHGLSVSRDTRSLHVTNRLGGS